MKKKLINITATVAVLAALLVGTGTTSAYLTDRPPPLHNVVTLGNVRINLTEEGWVDDTPKELAPDGSLEKKPIVKNTGTNDAWVRLRVALDSNTVNLLRSGDLTIDEVNTNDFTWDRTPASLKDLPSTEAAKGVELTATYRTKLPVGSSTPPIFTGISLMKSYIERESDSSLSITITAEAVQPIGNKTAEQCFGAINIEKRSV